LIERKEREKGKGKRSAIFSILFFGRFALGKKKRKEGGKTRCDYNKEEERKKKKEGGEENSYISPSL